MPSHAFSIPHFIAACVIFPALAISTGCSAQDGPHPGRRGCSAHRYCGEANDSNLLKVALAPNALSNSALWSGLDDKDAMDKGKGSRRLTNDKTMMVHGAIATPLDIGPLQDATISALLRFKVPGNCADYTSVALAFYDVSGQPFYAVVIFFMRSLSSKILARPSVKQFCASPTMFR